jgi:hypothetical protein
MLVRMHCYDMWTKCSFSFQVVRLPKTEYTMTKFPATQCHCMVHGRVLTLVLLGGVEAFRSPRRVMMIVSCLLGSLVKRVDTSAYRFYLELGQYS